MTQSKSNHLTTAILWALGLGALFGVILFEWDPSWKSLSVEVFTTGGSVFIRLLKFLVVPVVFVSLVCGVASFDDLKSFGRIFTKTTLYYLATTASAVMLALFVSYQTNPGAGFTPDIVGSFQSKEAPSLASTILEIFPENIFASAASGEMLQIIVAALLVGLAIAFSRPKSNLTMEFFDSINHVVMTLVELVMKAAPLGVFCLMTKTFSTQGLDAVVPLAKYFFTVLIVLLLHLFGVYSLLLKFIGGLSPKIFFKKFKEVFVFAFSTSSSNATIPVTMRVVTDNLGVAPKVTSFTIPFGATVNMDGTSIMQGVATVFIAQMAGIDLTMGQLAMVVLTATLASIGTAGVPSVGLVTLTMVLTSVGLPIEGVGIILGVDRLLDMSRTVVNVSGDAMVTCVVAKSEGLLDEKIYNS